MEGDLKQKLLRRRKEEEEEEEEELSLAKRVWNESKVMWIVAAPAIFTRFSTFGISVISQAFVGHIGSKELAAYALVFTVLVRFANGVLVRSFSSNLDNFYFVLFCLKKKKWNKPCRMCCIVSYFDYVSVLLSHYVGSSLTWRIKVRISVERGV